MEILLLITSLIAGLAVGWSFWALFGMKVSGKNRPAVNDAYEPQRLEALRSSSNTFEFAEQLIQELVRIRPLRGDAKEVELQLALSMQPRWKAWKPNEFMLTKSVEAGLVALVLVLLLWPLIGAFMALLVGGIVGLFYPLLSRNSVLSQLKRQLAQGRSRLPFIVDQIALMMQSGANFEESLKAVVEDDSQHPLTRELAVVLNEIETGVTRREALLNLRSRIPSNEIEEFVFAVTKGEELGTPLSEILLEQSEQMRVKRSLWGEKAAAEAEVQIVFPGMLVMIACLIVVLGPIMLPPIVNLFAGGE